MNPQKIATYLLDLFYPGRVKIENVFDSDFKKRVLISYITFPFLDKKRLNLNHSSNAEAIIIARVFDSLGYIVDVIRYNADFKRTKFKNRKYDLIFGLEPNFLKATKLYRPEKSIYYATGAYCKFQNRAEKSRLSDLKKTARRSSAAGEESF